MAQPLLPASNAQASKAMIDNLIRRELKVGDPSDPAQIAQALADRYQSSNRARAIDGEARGLPFLNTPIVRGPELAVQTASDIDLQQARSDVHKDIEELLRSNHSKDIRPELEGWQQIIVRSIDEGVASARMGLDPQRRDTAFAMRRQLGEYARLSRLVGAMTPELNRSYRDLALSLDEVSSVLLVLMGESMANLGFSGGRFLLQVPYAELQARRDGVLNALRLVDGASAEASAPGVWPRGKRAYRALSQQFETNGQGDLRSLLNEAEMSRTLDQLVQLSSGGTPYGMRSIGASAWAPVNRLYRFVQVTLQPVASGSPELANLHEAMMLFLAGFAQAGGFRLLRVARPTVLNYGLYGSGSVSRAEQRLIELVNQRGSFARQLDNLMQCACDEDRALAQIVLDSVLYDLDRAIDYYCVGADDEDFGVPEARAAAFSLKLDALMPPDLQGPGPAYPIPELGYLKYVPTTTPTPTPTQNPYPKPNPNWPWLLTAATPLPPQIARPQFLVNHLGPQSPLTAALDGLRSLLRPRPAGGLNRYPQEVWWDAQNTEKALGDFVQDPTAWSAGVNSGYSFAGLLKEELALQKQTDQEWRSVVGQMTTGFVNIDKVFANPAIPSASSGCLTLIADRAIHFLVAATAGAVPFSSIPVPLRIPPNFEDSLEVIAQNN
jgi:hypothetical protein